MLNLALDFAQRLTNYSHLVYIGSADLDLTRRERFILADLLSDAANRLREEGGTGEAPVRIALRFVRSQAAEYDQPVVDVAAEVIGNL